MGWAAAIGTGLGLAGIGASIAGQRASYNAQMQQAQALQQAQQQSYAQATQQMNQLQMQQAAQMQGLQRQAMQYQDQAQAQFMTESAALRGLQNQYAGTASSTIGPQVSAALGLIPGVVTSNLGTNGTPNLGRQKLLGN